MGAMKAVSFGIEGKLISLVEEVTPLSASLTLFSESGRITQPAVVGIFTTRNV